MKTISWSASAPAYPVAQGFSSLRAAGFARPGFAWAGPLYANTQTPATAHRITEQPGVPAFNVALPHDR